MGIKKYYYLLLITLSLWTIVAIYLSISNPTVKLSDMFWFIWIGEHLFKGKISVWVNGFYPFGYPLLLNILSHITNDYVISGRIISLISGIAGISTIFLMTKRVFGEEVAFFSAILIAINPVYLKYATTSSTDMIATAILLGSIYQFIIYLEKNSIKRLIISGTLSGLSYLFRYTSLTVIPVILIILIVKREKVLKKIFIFSLSFILVSMPQLILSFSVKGNPLYNLEYQNVYFGIFGNGNWGQKMREAANYQGLFKIIFKFPKEFFKNWGKNLLKAFKGEEILFFPLNLIAIPGFIFSLRYKKFKTKSTFIFLSSLFFLLAISTAFINKRLLLFVSTIFTIFAAFMIKKLFRGEKTRIIVFSVISILLFFYHIFPQILYPIPQKDINRLKVSEIISKKGVKSDEVLSFSFEYYDTTKKTKDRFKIPWHDEKNFIPYKSVKDIAKRMKENGEKILIYDERATFNVLGLKDFWPPDERELKKYFIPVATVSNNIKIYQLKNF